MMLRATIVAFALAAVTACSGSHKGSQTEGSGGSGSGSDTTTGSDTTSGSGSAATAPGMGETCGDGDVCAAGLECVHYRGIAGAAGPDFHTCEIKCAGDKETACPSGTKCVTIADGPGQVCRPEPAAK